MKIHVKIFIIVGAIILIVLPSFLLLYNSELNDKTLLSINGGGVVLTFDDRYIQDWYDVDKVLDKYNWRATFFISYFSLIDEHDKQMLKDLQYKGHEIGSHGSKHLNATKFISNHSIEEYIDVEITPSLHQMRDEGFIVNSFAYPYGARTANITLFSSYYWEIKMMLFGYTINNLDKQLLNRFSILRGTTHGKSALSKNYNFSNGSRVVFGLGIDESYGYDIQYLLKILEYAKKNNKIVIFYAHRVTQETNPPKYTTTYETLEEISKYVVKNNMHFMTMKDLLK